MVSDGNNTAEAIGLTVIRARVQIVREIGLTIARGETVAIMGPNGAGKSTLLACLAGALRPTTGEICCFGNSPSRSAAAKRQIGFVGHQTGLYGELTALENLIFAARMYGIDCPTKHAQTFLAETGLEQMKDRRVAQLSQGARRRLAIARAFIHDPHLILLDEPFASLDANGSEWLELLFQKWRDTERTVCFVSHDVEQSRYLADRIIWLKAGRIAATDWLTGQTAFSRKTA